MDTFPQVAGTVARGSCAIVGAGTSAIGEVPGVSPLELQASAVADALADAGLTTADVDGLIVRGPDDVYCYHQRVGQRLGIDPRFSTSLDNGGASQAMAVGLAALAIRSGWCTTVVCGYARDGWSRTRGGGSGRGTAMQVALVPAAQQAREFGPEYGLFGAAAMHAFGATRHMHLYGTTKQDMGAVALTFRQHAARNPKAQRRTPLTMEDYLQARGVVDPFNVLDCSLLTDGAGAVVVTSAERARDLPRPPVHILGVGSANNSSGWLVDDHMTTTAAAPSGRQAFASAGLGPEDIHTAQLYDCFTSMVLVQLEDYGFCAKGEGGAFASSGALGLDGQLPTNTSGGQLSEGHVEGMLQIVEAVRQLRGDHPPERQVAGAQTALVSGHGGNAVCHSTLILGR